MAQNSGFLSSCDGYLKEPPELHKRESSLLSSFERELGIALEAMQGNLSPSRDEVGNTVLFSGFGRNLGVPLELQQESREPLESHKGSQASFPV